MAVYKISDILLKLGEMIEDGHAFVELDEYPKEDDSRFCLLMFLSNVKVRILTFLTMKALMHVIQTILVLTR